MAKTYSHLIPSVERRLSAWVSIVEKRGSAAAPESGPTVTLSREFGCEGFPLAERLKALFDEASGEPWNIYDKALLERVSRDEQLSMDLLERLGGPSRATDTIGFLVPGYRSHHETFRVIAKHILRIAEAGHAIIVGRGGAIITQKLPNCYHFRLIGSFDFRARTVARRLEMELRDAEQFVRENEKVRDRFIQECLGVSVSNPACYDAVFNNERLGVEQIARAIVRFVSESWPPKRAARPEASAP